MAKKVISLSIDEDVYEAYRKLCEEKGLIMSKQVELFMKREIERWKDERRVERKTKGKA